MRIVVRGIPAAQGSKRHVGNGRMVESSRAVGPWREAVRAETQRAANDGPVDGAVGIEATFFLPRPKSLPRRVLYPSKRPDLDKLLRALLDGLTAGGAWLDDSQVVEITARKVYARPSDWAGCVVDVDPVEGVEMP